MTASESSEPAAASPVIPSALAESSASSEPDTTFEGAPAYTFGQHHAQTQVSNGEKKPASKNNILQQIYAHRREAVAAQKLLPSQRPSYMVYDR